MGSPTVLVQGIAVPIESMGTNDGLNYGRFFGRAELPCTVRIPVSQLRWLAEPYRAAAREMQLDDRLDDAPSPYALLDYEPDFDRATRQPTALAAVIGYFFDRDVLAHHVPYVEGQARYVINATDHVAIVDDCLVIRGRCWQR